MKNKIHRDLPWKPTCWVGGHRPVQLCDMDQGDMKEYIKYDSARKGTAAILRAMRK